jgi:hypothetical protein
MIRSRRKECTPMTTVRMIPDEEATGLVRAVYDDIKATKGIDFVPNFWRTIYFTLHFMLDCEVVQAITSTMPISEHTRHKVVPFILGIFIPPRFLGHLNVNP